MRLNDLRLGFRLLARQPLTAITATIALTVGIALANVGFATIEAMLFSRLPFDGGERFVRLSVITPLDRNRVALDAGSYPRLIAGASHLEHVGAAVGGVQNARLPDGLPAELPVTAITVSSLRYIPGAPIRGRALSSSDAAPGAPPVAVISEPFWRRSLGASEAVVGTSIVIGTTARTIVGVMPESFEFPDSPALWTPLDERFRSGAGLLGTDARLFGVLAPGSTLEALSVQLEGLAPQFRAASAADGSALVEATEVTDLGELASPLAFAILLAVLAVLAVIAANVGNLVLVRSLARAREFSVRAALGASRGRLIAQVMSEVTVIAAMAAILGSLAAQAALRQINASEDLPFWVDFTGSPLTAAMVALATLLATAIAGAWPAFRATGPQALGSLRSDGRAIDVAFGRTAGLIVVAQIALSVVLLHGAIIVAQSLRNYASPAVPLPANVLTMGISSQQQRTSGGVPPVSAHEVERHAAAMPGVIAAGLATALPRHSPPTALIEVEPLPGESPMPLRRTPTASVSPAYFGVLRGEIRAGRNFTAADAVAGAEPVAIVNEPFVRDVLRGAGPIGRRIRATNRGEHGEWLTIVGVVPDLGLSAGDPSLAAGFYTPLENDAETVYLAMRTAGEPMTFAEPLRRWLRERDPGVNMFRAQELDDIALDDRAFFAVLSKSLTGIGGITLVLALVGVYSMMSLVITRRTREIGIRVALGATPAMVIGTVARRAGFQVLAGGAIGALLARFSLEGRDIFVSRLSDGGSWTLPLVILLLVGAGLAATWVPLRRALRIKPQEALKAE